MLEIAPFILFLFPFKAIWIPWQKLYPSRTLQKWKNMIQFKVQCSVFTSILACIMLLCYRLQSTVYFSFNYLLCSMVYHSIYSTWLTGRSISLLQRHPVVSWWATVSINHFSCPMIVALYSSSLFLISVTKEHQITQKYCIEPVIYTQLCWSTKMQWWKIQGRTK